MSRSACIPFHRALAVGGLIKVILEPGDELRSDTIAIVRDDYDRDELLREYGIIVDMSPAAFSSGSPVPDNRIKIGDMAIFAKSTGTRFADPHNSNIIYCFLTDDKVKGFIPKAVLDECGYDQEYALNYNPSVLAKKDNQAQTILKHIQSEENKMKNPTYSELVGRSKVGYSV